MEDLTAASAWNVPETEQGQQISKKEAGWEERKLAGAGAQGPRCHVPDKQFCWIFSSC